MKKGLKLLVLATGVIAVTALVLGGTVFADSPEGTETEPYCAGLGGHGFHGDGINCAEAVSDLLGLTPEELSDLRHEGASLAEIAADRGVTTEELVSAIMAEKTTAVEALVADGTITQEQADLMIAQMTERTELAVTRTTTGPVGWHMGGGYGACSEGNGPGLGNRWGAQSGNGACYGDAGAGMGPGARHCWAR